MKAGKKTILFIALAAVLLIGIIAAAIVVDRKNTAFRVEGVGQSPNKPQDLKIQYDGTNYVFNENISTLLFMGIDDFGPAISSEVYKNDGQADFLVLVIMNEKDKTYSLLHINRDTMTDVTILGLNSRPAGTSYAQIATAHAYGSGLEDSCRNTTEAVSNLLGGVPVDSYLSLTMDGVAALNDLIGGITLTVTDEFYDVPEFVPGQEVTLTGDLALKYVRSRRNAADGSNLNRMQRQQQYIELFIDKLAEKGQDEDFAMAAFDEVEQYMVTDMTINRFSELSERINDYSFKGIETIAGEAIQGKVFIEYYVDESALEDQIVQLFFVPA